MSGRILHSLKSFIADVDGNLGITFAMVLVMIGVAGGMAVDYTRMSNARTQLQNATDSAALAAAIASGTNAQREKAGTDVYLANTLTGCTNAPSIDIGSDEVEVQGNCTIRATLMSLAGLSDLHVKTTAKAGFMTSSGFRCIHALNSSNSEALIYNNKRGPLLYTGDSIVAPKCDVQVNSAHADALFIKEDEGYEFARHCIVGGVSGDITQIKPQPDPSCKVPLPDPLSARSLPVAPACGTGTMSSTGDTLTLSPGSFCGGVNASADNIVLNSGVYHVTSGDFQLSADKNITGNGVTIVMHPGSGAISMETSGHLNLKAIETGATAKLLIFDRNGSAEAHLIKTDENDVSSMTLEGIIYTPEDHFELFWKRAGVGAGEKPLYFNKFSMIADTIDLHGYNQLYIEPPEPGPDLPELSAGMTNEKVRLLQ